MERKRTVVMSDDSAQNVKTVGTYRLNNALASIKTFGQCYTGKFDWTDEQIETAETALSDAVVLAMKNITDGVKIAKAGIQL